MSIFEIVLSAGLAALIVLGIVICVRLRALERRSGAAKQASQLAVSNTQSILNTTNQLVGICETMQKHTESNATSNLEFVRVVRGDLEQIRSSVNKQLDALRDDNNRRLDEMRKTVDEKLQSTLNERLSQSFDMVSKRLEQVYTQLGEMNSLAGDVGDLKRVLANVKTRGILGEVQLQAILEDILVRTQYDCNVATIPQSAERVEFAVKIPTEMDAFIWLPIDSKFPGDTYQALLDAQDSGDPEAVERARKALMSRLKQEARDIHEKYVQPPHTTEFGIMFLPTEGLYAEVVRCGAVEILQREFKVNVAGPSTMAALLNSLQMAFRTIAIQRRSDEVWRVLGAVKAEFEKFETVLLKAQDQVDKAGKQLELLSGPRTRAMRRVLREVESLPDSGGLLDLAGLADDDN